MGKKIDFDVFVKIRIEDKVQIREARKVFTEPVVLMLERLAKGCEVPPNSIGIAYDIGRNCFIRFRAIVGDSTGEFAEVLPDSQQIPPLRQGVKPVVCRDCGAGLERDEVCLCPYGGIETVL